MDRAKPVPECSLAPVVHVCALMVSRYVDRLTHLSGAVLSAAEPNEAFITFYRIWVRKEAVLKAEGCGLGGCLQSFSVARRQVACTEWLEEVHFVESGREWRVVDLTPAPDHSGALALPQGSVVYRCVAPDIGL